MDIRKRQLLTGIASLTAGAAVSRFAVPRGSSQIDRRQPRSRVCILNADQYSDRLEGRLIEGLRLFSHLIVGKTVMLKPNLVEFIPGVEVNTNPKLVGAAAYCLLRLGAKTVVVAEGPGHQRDTDFILSETGLAQELSARHIEFVDLNRDDLVETRLLASYTGLGNLWLPKTVLSSALIVSMPKVKTHHWVGVTLSMKNMFGVVPGLRYGWPKNVLHWSGIHESILDICATVPVGLVIADAIVCMEGNGPLNGQARRLNRIIISDDPVAADATCTRLMGFVPERIPHLREGAHFLGRLDRARIDQIGEKPVAGEPFATLPEFRYLVGKVDL